MKDEYTSNIICSQCAMPVFREEENVVWLMLDPFYGVVFCDLYCCREFMKHLSNKEIEIIHEI